MNPIVYNKNGQYRFTDFIGYLPEFLRSEPDVVTYLQVMSDYINNAYRNVDVTEEFELVKVCTSTDRTRVQTWMERLCEMFKLACDRGESVMYLSVPRNNVKSNVTIGSANAEYQRTIEVDLDEIVDTLSSADTRLGRTDLEDGDVVYVKYRKRKLGELVAYYYVKDANILQKDAMGTSQDPFTGSYNDPTTALQFKVSDVGNVVCRYGGNHGDMVYYEVYFPVHITGVERVSSSGIATYDVDADGKDDSIYVDYYNLTGATKTEGGAYNTYIKFGDENGFNWTGDYPAGMFYFRDSSGAKLTNLTNAGTMDISDTIADPSVDRYHITEVKKMSGMYRVYLEAFPGIYSNAIFYIMNGAENFGVYRMNGTISAGDRFDEGRMYVDLVNMSDYDYHIEDAEFEGKLTLLSIPLAASKYIIDFDNKLPMVTWKKEITDLFEHVVGVSPKTYMKRASVIENDLLYNDRIERVASNTIQLKRDISDKITVGTLIWSPAFIGLDGRSPFVAQVLGVHRSQNGLFRVDITGAQINLGVIHGDDPVPIYNLSAGVLVNVDPGMTDDDGEFAAFNAAWYGTNPIKADDYIAAPVYIDDNEEPTDVLFKVTSVYTSHNGGRISVQKPAGMKISLKSLVSFVRVAVDDANPASIYQFRYIKQRNADIVVGVAETNSYTGDVFSAKYMLASVEGSSDYSLLCMETDVKELHTGNLYTGDYVYDPADRQVKYITRDVTVNELGEISDTNRYTVDMLAHYSVGFKQLTNSYMPYCGPVSTLDYDEKVNYQGNMKTLRLPLYVKKVNDVRLKYGWQQRQYVYYNDDIGVAPMDRSGFVELYSDSELVGNDRNPVNINLRKTAHVLLGSAVLSGCGSRWYTIDIDTVPVAQRNEDGDWVITVQSSGHGLSDGARVTATVKIDDADKQLIFNAEDVPVTVISADAFQYVTSESKDTGYVAYLGDKTDLEVKYDRSYYLSDEYPQEGDIVVVNPAIKPLSEVPNYELRDDVYPIIQQNEIAVGGSLYLVTKGNWVAISPSDIITPHAIYCRHNLFDESVTNPTFARSESYYIKSIKPDNENHTAEILLSGRIPEFDVPNAAEIYNGKGRVYIEFVNQGVLCGWHTIESVHNGGAFSIYIDPLVEADDLVVPITNRRMTVYVGQWYKYTLKNYDWDKKSNLVSYVTSNMVMEHLAKTPYRYKMKYKHGLTKGDHVLIDPTGKTVYSVDSSNIGTIKEAVVTDVIDDYTIELNIDNAPDGYIFKGYIINDRNIGRLRGEYSVRLGDELVRFKDGDVVITMAQVCLDERRAWKVAEKTAWVPMAAKRTFKVDQMSVDMKRNPAYDAGEDLDEEVEYKYVTYTDADVYNDAAAYTVGYACARNYHFEHPHVDNLDTTQKVELEYSSKYDYATVAPRDDMDPSFKGVPDMGYPLAERIERLAYLRDPEVIDLDLIGYLARFMGYDITAVADDINSSNIYRNSTEREAAIRETIAHLPQFYTLSGTKPGINMLMATFGLVGDLITMWTNTDDPYGKLIRQDKVHEQMDIDLANGKTTSSWVPTPHVVLDIIENENFNSVLMGNEELTRMKEQIRRCKPIQVVFDGIRVVFNGVAEVQLKLATSGGSVQDSTYLIDLNELDDVELAVDPCMEEDCDF